MNPPFESPSERRARRRENGAARLTSYFARLDVDRAATARRRGWWRGFAVMLLWLVAILFCAGYFRPLLP